MTLEGMIGFHTTRVNLWRQAAIISGLSFLVFICAVVFLALGPNYSDVIWTLIVGLLSAGGMGYFVFSQKATAQSADYAPTMIFLIMGIILSVFWLSASGATAAGYSYYYCTVSSVYSRYGLGSYVANYTGLCVTGALSNAFGWLAFIGCIFFSLTTYALGSRSGSFGGGSGDAHKGAVPAFAQPGPGSFAQQAYGPGPGPQGAFPQQPQDAYSPAAAPQQPYSPQIGVQTPYSPAPPPQQAYSPGPGQPYPPTGPPAQPYGP